MIADAPSWTIAPQPAGSPESAALLRAYLVDIADRWYRLHHDRGVTPEEIERHLAEMAADDLAPPHGVLLVARYGGEPAGCAGLLRRDAWTAEVTKVFVREDRRGLGGAPRLMAAAEETARGWGARRLVLNTRRDLVEARALYARHGFTAIEPYKPLEEDPFAEVWLGKELGA
ncbi:GNAT family N-acetyltransferase [Streptomyces triculaminicus]|uniref:GNAT family N-acetyltransferase n=2 Tax=Streptomyces TaxID=1883 RepID=A0A939JUI1_9ACTN|nr:MULTISPECIES: GNAT family N-acetyltransferase [Streptomyces]MBO0656789.1 GNAT family N-acetyltransferase [Streptomyces triculaminicus]QSY47778.1 GNAT family N-acetyltransferase [Streptomyces griseocarneus]